jgi:hypothetical protein
MISVLVVPFKATGWDELAGMFANFRFCVDVDDTEKVDCSY